MNGLIKKFPPEEIAAWCGGEWAGSAPDRIDGFCKDSREDCRGLMYFALSGERHDGHNFIEQAVANGASAVLASMEYKGAVSVPCLKVKDTTKALQDIARGYRIKLAPFVVGVTGSSGKTTVKTMTALCLGRKFKTASTKGNWNNHIGLPLSLLAMDADCEAAVIEAGMNHGGELEVLCRILAPDWGIVTNVGPVHLEYFESVEAVAREKAVLLDSLPQDGCAFLDADSRYFKQLSESVHCELVTVSASQGDYTYDLTDGAVRVSERSTGKTCELSIPIPGIHIAYDAVLAAAVARKKGVEWGQIADALSGMKALPMRWDCESAGGVMIINDAYNANPMSMRASISAFMEMDCGGARWLVLGDMLELGSASVSEHRELGRWLSGKGALSLVAVGKLAGEMVEGLDGDSGINAFIVSDAKSAGEKIRDAVGDGDAVLFKGSRGIGLEKVSQYLVEYLRRNETDQHD